ncbi:MAG TPA: TonB-dependent receptor [Stellaceae bacterium]|nr:TonB-dependent receptor [Stellaceae bacterium]
MRFELLRSYWTDLGCVARYGRAASYLAAVSAYALAVGAAAQEAASPAPQSVAQTSGQKGLEEVVVTAEKRSSTVQNSPLSVTALSGDSLQAEGVTGLAGVAAETPGISFRTSGPGQSELEMRGIASGGGSSPTVGFYLDETPLTPPAASLNGKVVIDPSLFDLQRVEVLRGPQGTLYGAGSMGGTVRLITNQPDFSGFSGNIDASLSGTEGGGVNPSLNVALNIPIVDDKLAIRVVGSERYIDGWIDRIVVAPFPEPINPCASLLGGVGCERGNVLAATQIKDNQDVNWEWVQSGRVGILFKPTDEFTIDTTLLYQRITMGGYSTYDQPPGQSPVLAHYQPFDIPEPFSDTFRLYSTTLNYDLGWSQITSNTSYWSREEKQSQDISEALRTNFEQYYGADILSPISFVENDYSHQFSEELRLASKGDSDIQWLIGGFYSELESIFFDINQAPAFASASVGGAAANPFGLVYDANNPYHVTQYAFFGEGSYSFFDTWKLTLGLRYYNYETHVDEQQEGNLTASGNATPTIAHFDTAASGFTPKFNLSWEPDDTLTVYAEASKGFRPGGVNLPLPPFCQALTETYPPDSLWDYEIGEKARLLDNRVQLNADFYYIQWSNVQQLVNQSCGYSLTTIAGDAVSYGPELEVTARLTPEVTAIFAGAYTDAHLTTINPATQQVSTTLLAPGTPILNIPNYTASTTIRYTRPINDTYTLNAWVRDSYVGPTTDSSYYYVHLEPYNMVDMRVGVEAPDWSAYFFIDNLTDKHAELSSNTTSFSWIVPSLTRITTNQPRTFGINLAYRFGGPETPATPTETVAPPPPPPPPPPPQVEAQRQFQVFFDFDKSNITEAAAKVIQAAAAAVKAGNVVHLTVTGHTDTVGTASYNQGLSERRAASVKTELVKDGVDGGEIATVGVGKTGLLVPTGDGVREPQNRRAVIDLQ